MTFPRVNGASWSVQDPFTSAQANELDINITESVDATQGGSYILGSSTRGDGTFEFDFSGVPDAGQTATFRTVMSDDLPAMEILSTLTTPGTTGMVIDVSLGTTGDILRRGLVVTGGDRGNAIVGTGGATGSDANGPAGAGLQGIGGDHSGGSDISQFGGIGVIGQGGSTDTSVLTTTGGIGGFFTGGASAGGDRNGGNGIVVLGGQPTGTGVEGTALIATVDSASNYAVDATNNSGTAINIIQTDSTPTLAAMAITPSAAPTSDTTGGVFFSNVVGSRRLGFFNTDDSAYQVCSTLEAAETSKVWGRLVSVTSTTVVTVEVSSGLGFTAVVNGSNNLLLTWTTPFVSSDYIIVVSSGFLSSTHIFVPGLNQSSTSIEVEGVIISSGAGFDMEATAWELQFVVYALPV